MQYNKSNAVFSTNKSQDEMNFPEFACPIAPPNIKWQKNLNVVQFLINWNLIKQKQKQEQKR